MYKLFSFLIWKRTKELKSVNLFINLRDFVISIFKQTALEKMKCIKFVELY